MKKISLVLTLVLCTALLSVTAYAAPADIPDAEIPLVASPTEPGPLRDIPDEEVPLANISDEEVPLTKSPDQRAPLTDILDEDIPLVASPQTGDAGLNGTQMLSLLALVFGVSGTALLAKAGKQGRVR